jgi:hypothetical protein
VVLVDRAALLRRHFWPDAVQQECLVHVECGLCARLSYNHQGEAVMKMNRLRAVDGAEAGEEAFEQLLKKEKNNGFHGWYSAQEELVSQTRTLIKRTFGRSL